MSFLTPEKSVSVLKAYRYANLSLIPLSVFSVGMFYIDGCNFSNNFFHMATITTMTFHSYVSTSYILSDYVKSPKVMTTSLRMMSANAHLLAATGFVKMILDGKNLKKK